MDDNLLAIDLDLILEHTRDLWEELRGQRMFITGGTGFFGCWLLETLAWVNTRLNLGVKAVVLTRDNLAFKTKVPHLAENSAIEFTVGDIRNFQFPSGSFSHVIHAATPASAALGREQPSLMFDIITHGMQRTLEFCDHCNVQKILFTSSGAVYGKQPPDISHLSEDYPVQPYNADEKTAYSNGKIKAEELLVDFVKRRNIEGKIARCFAFVGPYLPLNTHFAIGNFILAGLQNRTINVNGDGTPLRSYLYAADLIIWLITILMRGKNCQPYNVGSENVVSIAELAKTVAQHFSPQSGVIIAHEPRKDGIVEQYIPSTQLAARELGLRQLTSLDEAIEKTKRSYLQIGNRL